MKNKKKLHISRVGKRINSFVRLMPSHFAIEISEPSNIFKRH